MRTRKQFLYYVDEDLSKSSMKLTEDIGEVSQHKKELISVWAEVVTTKIARRVVVAAGDLATRLTDLAIFVNTKVTEKSPCWANNIFIVY